VIYLFTSYRTANNRYNSPTSHCGRLLPVIQTLRIWQNKRIRHNYPERHATPVAPFAHYVNRACAYVSIKNNCHVFVLGRLTTQCAYRNVSGCEVFTASRLFTSTTQTAVLLKQAVRALRHAETPHHEVLCLLTAIQASYTSRLRMRQAASNPTPTLMTTVTSRDRKPFAHRRRFPKNWILTNTATDTSNISSFDLETRRGKFL